MLSLAHRRDGWMPPLIRCVATEGQGASEALAACRSFHESGTWTPARRAKLEYPAS